MMPDFLGWIADTVRSAWLTARNRPRVTCDNLTAYQPRWCPDWFLDDSGNEIASGIQIEVYVNFLLANEGPVDTSIKDIYIDIEHNRNKHDQLRCPLPVQKVEIAPRRTWGPKSIEFTGSIWDVDEPSHDWKAEFVVEPLAQRPIRRKIKLYFNSI